MVDHLKHKIIFLFTPGPMGGAEKVVINGLKALLDAGVNAELWVIKEERVPQVALAFISALNELHIPFRAFSSRKIYDHQLMGRLKEEFSNAAPDIIHAHGFKAAFYGKFITPLNSRLVVTHHGKSAHTFKVRVYEYIENLILQHSHGVIAVSRKMGHELEDNGVDPKKLFVVENLLTSSLHPKPKHGSNKDFYFVGRLSPEKGLRTLLEAMNLIPDPSIRLTVLGDGVQRHEMEVLVSTLGLNERVTFLGFQPKVHEHLAQARALIMPSLREGQPLSLIEACCMGIPVIASGVGGIPDLIRNGENGFLIEPQNCWQLAGAIKEFIAREEEMHASADKLKQKFIDKFSSRTWVANTTQVYQTVMSQS